jgi:prefoldin subunit 1
MAASEREKRMLQLTQNELTSHPSDTSVYIGVGKMLLLHGMTNLRFMRDDLDVVKKNLESQIKEHNEGVENLKKKQVYLETTFKNAQSHINEILGRR